MSLHEMHWSCGDCNAAWVSVTKNPAPAGSPQAMTMGCFSCQKMSLRTMSTRDPQEMVWQNTFSLDDWVNRHAPQWFCSVAPDGKSATVSRRRVPVYTLTPMSHGGNAEADAKAMVDALNRRDPPLERTVI